MIILLTIDLSIPKSQTNEWQPENVEKNKRKR